MGLRKELYGPLIYVFVTLYHVCLFINICERTTNQFDQKTLHQDKYFSKKVLFGWSEVTALLNNCLEPYIVHYTE